MPAPNLVAQQPRWVLLSAFLFFWSLSSGLRRDGPGRALGLGVDARAHLPVADNLVLADEPEEYASTGIWRRQVGIPNCAALCASQASDTVGCGQGINLACACHSPSFLPDTVNCMEKNCTSIDEQLGQQALESACRAVGTSTSSPPSTSASASSTSISSGVCHGCCAVAIWPPPICTTGSPTGSPTTTVSVTVTITSSASGSSTPASNSGSSSPTSTSPPVTSEAPSGTTTGSVPVVTTTTMLTTSSTVLIPTSSATSPPVTTVTSTSTLGSAPSSGTGGGDAGTTGTGTGVGDGSTNGAARVAPALGVALLGLGMMWVL
ncbi:hypothetical protein FKP32DRAFT_1666256 [Trametes sanguinea]|nr:hypothetical protein FKP32DRAFT_1666256 [Trametes sanguinea]